ncbi:6-bladed beta-propeller [Viscerimonas tarda]
MKNIIYLLVIITSVIFSQCENVKVGENYGIIDDSEIVVLNEFNKHTLADTLCFRTCNVIPLETNEKSLLRDITRICMDGDTIFIFDKSLKKVVVFESSGKYLTQIHRVGQGPKEYIQVIDFCVDKENKQIILLCDRPYKAMFFSYNGDFIKETKTDKFYYQIMADRDHIYCESSPLESNGNLVLMDKNFQTDKNLLEAIHTKQDNVFFSKGNTLTKTTGIYYTRQFDNNIYEIRDGEVYKKYTIDFKDHSLPEGLLNRDLSSDEFRDECYNHKYVCSITSIVNSKNYIMFNTNIGVFLLDKKLKTINGYAALSNSKYQASSNSFYSVGNSEDKVISVYQSDKIKHIENIYKKTNNEKTKNQAFLELASKIKEDDNPILFIYDFK